MLYFQNDFDHLCTFARHVSPWLEESPIVKHSYSRDYQDDNIHMNPLKDFRLNFSTALQVHRKFENRERWILYWQSGKDLEMVDFE